MGIFNRKNGEHDRSQFEFEDSFAKPSSTPQPPKSQGQNHRPNSPEPEKRSPAPPQNPIAQKPAPSPAARSPGKMESTSFETKVQNQANMKTTAQEDKKVNMKPEPSTKPSLAYSIEDAIVLMRELPSDQREMVVSIVQKTLSSANIDVGDIIKDASNKLAKLSSRKELLATEIADLQKGISQREEEITKISKDVEETQAVKDSFEAKINPKKAIENKVKESLANSVESNSPQIQMSDKSAPATEVKPVGKPTPEPSVAPSQLNLDAGLAKHPKEDQEAPATPESQNHDNAS